MISVSVGALIVLPYPHTSFVLDLLILLLLASCEWLRIFFARKGNLTESSKSLVFSLLMMIPCLLGVIFLLIWQVRMPSPVSCQASVTERHQNVELLADLHPTAGADLVWDSLGLAEPTDHPLLRRSHSLLR